MSLIHLLGFLVLGLASPVFTRINKQVRAMVGLKRNMAAMPLFLFTHKYSDLVSMTLQVIVLATILGLIWQDWTRALVLTAAMFSQTVATSITKRLTDRARPPKKKGGVDMASASYPSGHSASSMTFALVVPLILTPYLQPVFLFLISGYLFAVALLTAYGRLYLDVHWLTDVLGGWLLAGSVMHLCRLFLL